MYLAINAGEAVTDGKLLKLQSELENSPDSSWQA